MEGALYRGYNPGMHKRQLTKVILWVLTALLITACTPRTGKDGQSVTPILEGTLRPYPSETPSGTPFPTDYQTATPTPTVTPTPTPIYYDVQDGDDMYGIAFFYGISPQQLMTANPTVNPRAMGPGTTLLIPITPGPEATATSAVTNTPTPTPPYARLEEPVCYPDATGGLWCFVLLVNDEANALENVSAVVTLRFGEEVRQETAVMPLNFLPAGESLPLVAYFQPQAPEDYQASAAVDFYLPVMPGDDRYLPVEIGEKTVEISLDGEHAQISGSLALQGGEEAAYVWLHGTAFDAQGNVVAVRRWDGGGAVAAGESVDFAFSLYSLGEAIDRVDLVAEAHRRAQPTPTQTPTP